MLQCEESGDLLENANSPGKMKVRSVDVAPMKRRSSNEVYTSSTPFSPHSLYDEIVFPVLIGVNSFLSQITPVILRSICF